MLQAGDGARSDARSAFQILGGDAGQRGAPDLVTGRLPSLPRDTKSMALFPVGDYEAPFEFSGQLERVRICLE